MPQSARNSRIWQLWRRVRQARTLLFDRSGGLMVEAVVSMLLLTVLGTATMAGLSTTHISGNNTEEQAIAENIARNQMEYILTQAYKDPPASYVAIAPPSGYGVNADAVEFEVGDTSVEKIVVTVTRGGQTVLVVETIRTKQ